MAKYVYEVMNPEVMSIGPTEVLEGLHRQIIAAGITAVPVVSDHNEPLGVVSLRDLVAHPEARLAEEVMTSPAVAVDQHMEIESAAGLLCELSLHRLVAIDAEGCVVGMVSAVDLLRGAIGLPGKHPDTFPHFDRDTGVVWTDDIPLELETILRSAPEGPGVIVLIHGGRSMPETVVWAETTPAISSRLIDIVSGPQPKAIQHLLERGNLRYRATQIDDDDRRRKTLKSVANLGRSAYSES